ncbi:MAG: HlyC/CorC family transporter [Myxococcales bacterium]|nr:HlyC/CorC family transporter [Myxococcales bacterium]
MSEKEDLPRSRLRRLISVFRRPEDPEKVTEEALSDLELDGHIDHDESEMMQGVLYLDKTTVREVMVPRTEISSVDKDDPLTEIIRCTRESGHSRLPVVDGDLDKVLGFVHVKDLLRYWGREEQFKIEEILRKTYNVPETKKLDDLLREFQQRHEKFALVIDEFGGTSGMVTLEDILEEIVGEISDEYDKEEKTIYFQDENTLVVPGRFDINEFYEIFDLEELDGSFNTVGGWIFDRIGRVPQAGEILELDGFSVKIEAANERQIRRLRIQRPPQPAEE